MDTPSSLAWTQFGVDIRSWFTCYPGRPDYFTYWGGAYQRYDLIDK